MMFAVVQRYWTAMHEAGHAVMARDFGVPLIHVTIVPDRERETLGVCVHRGVREYTSLDYGIVMAGPWAEAWVNDDAWQLSWGDVKRADEILNDLVESGEWPLDEAEIVMRGKAMENILKRRLEGLRPQVERLAHELLIRQTMTGDEVEELFNTSPPKDATASPATVISERGAHSSMGV